MLRVIRSLLAAEGAVMSIRSYRQVRALEEQRDQGDLTTMDAIGLAPQASLFGVPNGIIAATYFAFVLVRNGTPVYRWPRARTASKGLSILSLSVSLYLVGSLMLVLRRNCPTCMRAHMLNLALTMATLAEADASSLPPC